MTTSNWDSNDEISLAVEQPVMAPAPLDEPKLSVKPHKNDSDSESNWDSESEIQEKVQSNEKNDPDIKSPSTPVNPKVENSEINESDWSDSEAISIPKAKLPINLGKIWNLNI